MWFTVSEGFCYRETKKKLSVLSLHSVCLVLIESIDDDHNDYNETFPFPRIHCLLNNEFN